MQQLTETQQKALRLFDEAASLERKGKIGDGTISHVQYLMDIMLPYSFTVLSTCLQA